LPIQVRFQKLDRNKQPFVPGPPRETEILWTPDGCTPSQRLASPVIVKPVQLREGRFVPVALWLDRELPASAQAGLADRPDSLAPMSAMPPSPLYSPLAGKASVKDAFMDWLTSTRRLQGGTL
jgi:hypothetical protein